MFKPIVATPAQISLQTERELRVLERECDHTVFEVVGFPHQVRLHDYRPIPTSLTSTSKPYHPFESPALVTIVQQANQIVDIELRPTDRKTITHTLWIAVGVDEFIPPHDTLFDQIDFVEDDRFAFLMLFKHSRRKLVA